MTLDAKTTQRLAGVPAALSRCASFGWNCNDAR